MQLIQRGNNDVQLNVSLDQMKQIYVALFCRLQTGGCDAFELLDQDDMLLTLQSYLQQRAAEQGIDCTVHEEWEQFLGITHPRSCPRRVETADARTHSSD